MQNNKIVLELYFKKIRIDVNKNFNKSLPFLTNNFINLMKPYVPMRSGNLYKSSYTKSNFSKGQIVYSTPYARKIYYNITNMKINTSFHKKATSKWAEVSLKNEKYKIELFIKKIKMGNF